MLSDEDLQNLVTGMRSAANGQIRIEPDRRKLVRFEVPIRIASRDKRPVGNLSTLAALLTKPPVVSSRYKD